MATNIFRQKSLDRVNAPEDLNSYLRVANPPIWFALAAITLLLVGAIVWGCVAKVETTIDGLLTSDGTTAVCYISEEKVTKVKEGAVVHADGQNYTVTAISESPVVAEDALNDYRMTMGGFKNGEELYVLSLDKAPAAGCSTCAVVLESISPIYFLISSSN